MEDRVEKRWRREGEDGEEKKEKGRKQGFKEDMPGGGGGEGRKFRSKTTHNPFAVD